MSCSGFPLLTLVTQFVPLTPFTNCQGTGLPPSRGPLCFAILIPMSAAQPILIKVCSWR